MFSAIKHWWNGDEAESEVNGETPTPEHEVAFPTIPAESLADVTELKARVRGLGFFFS